jgi:hypothetical protein
VKDFCINNFYISVINLNNSLATKTQRLKEIISLDLKIFLCVLIVNSYKQIFIHLYISWCLGAFVAQVDE